LLFYPCDTFQYISRHVRRCRYDKITIRYILKINLERFYAGFIVHTMAFLSNQMDTIRVFSQNMAENQI
jgi:hypothetical protein